MHVAINNAQTNQLMTYATHKRTF